MHEQFFNRLKTRLTQTLPGSAAQEKMASTLRTALRLRAKPDERTRRSAVLILFYPVDGQIYVPLILRPVYKGAHSGQVSFPGGRQEPGDLDLTATALRETYEEIGVRPADVETLGNLTPLFVPASNSLVQPVVGWAAFRPDFKPDAYEVAQLLEVPLAELQDITRIGNKEIIVQENVVVQAPYYDLQGQTVWGATAMIISELLAILGEISIAD